MSTGVYTVQVKDRVMLAHSFQGEEFGPAQKLHGMTAVVYAAYIGNQVESSTNTLLDIGDGFGMLARALDPYRYQNLDDIGEFTGQNTTVERICRAVWESIAKELQIRNSAQNNVATGLVKKLRIRIEETDVALAEFEADIPDKRRHFVVDLAGLAGKRLGEQNFNAVARQQVEEVLQLPASFFDKLAQEGFRGNVLAHLQSRGILQGDAVQEVYSRMAGAIDMAALKTDPLLKMQLLKVAEADVQWWIVSDWPHEVVEKVWQHLGLAHLSKHVVCPSESNKWMPSDKSLLQSLPQSGTHVFATSQTQVSDLTAAGMTATLLDGSVEAMGWIADALEIIRRSYRMSKDQYLRAKEKSDLQSLNKDVLAELETQLSKVVSAKGDTPMNILDLGAGMLSMLPVIASRLGSSTAPLHYVAVDWDGDLLDAAGVRLEKEFGAARAVNADGKSCWRLQLGGREVSVTMEAADVVAALRKQPQSPYSLILGCSILDLVDIRAVAAALQERHQGALLYFPIHYAGDTTFTRGPSNVHILTANYNDSLVARGQVSHVNDLLPLLGETLRLESSPWVLDTKQNDALFKQLLSFMATNAMGYHAPDTLAAAVRTATADAETCELTIANVDFLGVVPNKPVASSSGASQGQAGAVDRFAVEFKAPGVAHVVTEKLMPPAAGQAAVRSICSAVSAGTERRVFLEGIPSGEKLDVTLASMASQGGAWPLRYGYCLVGSVLTADTLTVGSRVFCFHPHASLANVAETDLHVVPDNVSDTDAAFFANVETAVSLVQDAAPVLGDAVAVIGAGTVGTLTAGVLSRSAAKVTVFEPDAKKCEALQRKFPGLSVLHPDDAVGDFDVCIEVSGSSSGLATALRKVRYGGKVVAASIYDEQAGPLPLGLQFHRSGVTIVTSQVSRISSPLAARWSKKRRAELVWEILADLAPSKWIAIEQVAVQDAADVYSKLATGEFGNKQIMFTYGST